MKTIMIVDDAISTRGLVKMTLENAGYQVIEACDGQDALKKLPGQKVNLLIVDLYMPNMDGMKLIKALKADPYHKIIPIVVLTKESEPSIKKQGQMAGAKAWIVKPFKPKSILTAVQKIIG
jgi:two-component system chemotaxis response regulator CheY